MFLTQPPDRSAKHEDEGTCEANGLINATETCINEAFGQWGTKANNRTRRWRSCDIVRGSRLGSTSDGSDGGHIHGTEGENLVIGFRTHDHGRIDDSCNGTVNDEIGRDAGDGIRVTFQVGMKTRDTGFRTEIHDTALRVLADKKEDILESLEMGFTGSRLEA